MPPVRSMLRVRLLSLEHKRLLKHVAVGCPGPIQRDKTRCYFGGHNAANSALALRLPSRRNHHFQVESNKVCLSGHRWQYGIQNLAIHRIATVYPTLRRASSQPEGSGEDLIIGNNKRRLLLSYRLKQREREAQIPLS